ncbi:MAG: HEPN domain-containing protein [Bacteroidales bacterium]|nr:HEPN domain-containing protein [Bacteroidales bacterium]
MKEITKEWLNFAKADIMSCKNNLHDDFLTNIVAFHAQQTVEKCFKAIVEENSLKFQHVHSLFKLHSIIANYLSFKVDLDQLEILDSIYTSSRYPGEIGLIANGKPSTAQVQEMYEFAKQIYENILQTIK